MDWCVLCIQCVFPCAGRYVRDTTGNLSRDRPTSSVAQRLNHYATPDPKLRKCSILIPIPNIFRLFLHFPKVYKSEASVMSHLWSRRYKQRKACDWETFTKPVSNKLCSIVAIQYTQSSLQCKPGAKGQCSPHWLALVLARALSTEFWIAVIEYVI